LANGRLANFKAAESAKKATARAGRSKSSEPSSALDKLRAATKKVVVANTFRHPLMNAGLGKADLGKVNDLKERLMRRRSVTEDDIL
jgi:hypothetical protein